MMDEYDKLKLEKQELEKQYMQLSEEYDEVNKNYLLSRLNSMNTENLLREDEKNRIIVPCR